MANDPASRMSASEFVADTLRREILRGDYSPGQSLLQDHIAARFEVSQSSVREALRRLEAQALVVSIRNRGTFVSSLTAEQVEEMYEIRLALELLAFRKSFSKIPAERLDEAEKLLQAVENEGEISFLGESNRRFHAIFYDTPGRKLGIDVLQNIYANLTRLWADFIKRRPTLARNLEERSHREHRQLLRAALAKDLPKAERILSQHIAGGRDILMEHLRDVEVDAKKETRSHSKSGRVQKKKQSLRAIQKSRTTKVMSRPSI